MCTVKVTVRQISCILLVSLSSPYVHDARSQEPKKCPWKGFRVRELGWEKNYKFSLTFNQNLAIIKKKSR